MTLMPDLRLHIFPRSPTPPVSRRLCLRDYHLPAHRFNSKAEFSSAPSAAPLHKPLRYAVLGAGFAGLSVAWHLLELSPKGSSVSIDVIDEVGIGGGASGVAGGLLHPYSPKARVLWRGAESWKMSLKLLDIAERIGNSRDVDEIGEDPAYTRGEQIVWRRGIIRPATTLKNAEILKENARSCLENCHIRILDKDAAQGLVTGLNVPFNAAVHMLAAVNLHPKRYLQALFLACKRLAADLSASDSGEKEINLLNKSVESLTELEGDYDSVIVSLGAKAEMLPELTGKLPIRTCRGVVAHLQLPENEKEEYRLSSPSILSEAWIAVQDPRILIMGSTWDWNSKNCSSSVSTEEASAAFEELLPKALNVYPALRKWSFVGATGGLRAMPPSTPLGSLPILGSVDDLIGKKTCCRYWLVGGLGARGLLYHGYLGNLMAQAVLFSNEVVLPPELTSWKKKRSLREEDFLNVP